MKTVFTTQEGVKTNANLDLGSTKTILHELKYFLVLSDSLYGVELKFYYRLIDDDYIQLAYSVLDNSPELITQFKRRYETLKENLAFVIHEYVKAHLPYQNKLDFERSPLFIKEEYEAIVERICSEKEANRSEANETITPLVTYLIEQELEPRPTGIDTISWIAACPVSQNHFIMLVTTTDEWWCGYCRKKGKLPELKAWLTDLNH